MLVFILLPDLEERSRIANFDKHETLEGTTNIPNTMAAALQERFQIVSADFQKIQSDLSLAVDARQKLEAQLSENELVKKVRSFMLFHMRVVPTFTHHMIS